MNVHSDTMLLIMARPYSIQSTLPWNDYFCTLAMKTLAKKKILEPEIGKLLAIQGCLPCIHMCGIIMVQCWGYKQCSPIWHDSVSRIHTERGRKWTTKTHDRNVIIQTLEGVRPESSWQLLAASCGHTHSLSGWPVTRAHSASAAYPLQEALTLTHAVIMDSRLYWDKDDV